MVVALLWKEALEFWAGPAESEEFTLNRFRLGNVFDGDAPPL